MNNSIIDKNQKNIKQPYESVGLLIFTMRESLGWNQSELAEKIDCTPGCVSSWESGRVLPQSKNVLRLADVFEMSPAEILMGMSCLDSAENETPEQAVLTNSVLREVMDSATVTPHHIVPESDQEIEDRIGTYKGDNKPVIGLSFDGNELATISITQHCKTIVLQPSDFPVLLIDLLAEVVRAK